MTEIHPKDRYRPTIKKVDRSQDRTVPSHTDHKVQVADENVNLSVRLIGSMYDVTLTRESLSQLAGLRNRLGTIFVDDKADTGHLLDLSV
ncbi:MAG: hypothetical protein VX833_04965 [Actinomycetota bacterium]|nr:hypothetical protein [Actinomycetota bacterium]